MFAFYAVSQSAILYMNQTPYINNPKSQIICASQIPNVEVIRKLFWHKTYGADVISCKTYSADVSIIFFYRRKELTSNDRCVPIKTNYRYQWLGIHKLQMAGLKTEN